MEKYHYNRSEQYHASPSGKRGCQSLQYCAAYHRRYHTVYRCHLLPAPGLRYGMHYPVFGNRLQPGRIYPGERSNSAAEKLSKMISNKADVLRDGVQTEIPIEDVVPGDMVRLSAGDMIPADIRFVFTKDAFVAQGSLYRGIESGRKICGYPFRQGRRADRPSKHRFLWVPTW